MTLRNTAIIISIAAGLCFDIATADTRTTRSGKLTLRTDLKDELPQQIAYYDSVSTDSLRIGGYDKPLRSLRETFFVHNNYSAIISSVSISFTYRSDDGLMLHSRIINIKCNIPPSETRQLSMTAWDRQYAYYYVDTRIKPRSKGAIPYIVEIEPLHVSFLSSEFSSSVFTDSYNETRHDPEDHDASISEEYIIY